MGKNPNEPANTDEPRVEPLERDLGYNFSAPPRPHAPGGNELMIHIDARPTNRHFDPKHVKISVWTAEGSPEVMMVRHPWTFGERYFGYPGRIHMIDRLGKEAHAFSFGGEWEIQSPGEITTLRLVSSAPILDCNEPNSINALLADEVEILMAEQRAHRHSLNDNLPDEWKRCDPMLVYGVCLQALTKKYQSLEASASPTLHTFHLFLEREITELAESSLMPADLPELDCLF